MISKPFICICLTMALLLIPLQGLHHTNPAEAHFPIVRSPEPPLSKYDGLIRQWADSIGWDWRILASVIYHESRFTNEAHSGKGAMGLMQINSPRYTAEQLLDPSTNIGIGSRYLRKLENTFEAATPLDSLQFALAAFNLGDGKLRRLRADAAANGLDPKSWADVSSMLPRGHHTVSYVKKVLSSYDDYRRKYPR